MLKRALLVIFLLLSHAIVAQTPDAFHNEIVSLYGDRDYLTTATLLRKFEETEPEAFRENNYDYLLARVEDKIGDTAAAASLFEEVSRRESVLKDYALWHLARIARSSGNLMLEHVLLQELVSFSPESLTGAAAERRLAPSWIESENYDLAIAQLEHSAASGDSSASTNSRDLINDSRKVKALLADAYLRSGDIAHARDIYSDLATNSPDAVQPDDPAIAAVRGLDMLQTQATESPLDDHEHFRRAGIYQFDRDFENARLHYNAIINHFPSSDLIPESCFQIGRGYASLLDHTEAVKWYERALERYPDHPVAADLLLYAASSYSRVGKFREAGVRYKRYIERFPNGPSIDRAYLNLIDILRDQREEIDAFKWIATIRTKFQDRQPAALATFAEARMYLVRTDWENALAALNRLDTYPDIGGPAVPGGTSRAEIAFLRGFTLEQMRRYPEAIEAYLSIPDGRNEYYGWRATEHLRLMSSSESARPFILAKLEQLRTAKSTDPDMERRTLQTALRLTDIPAEREKLLASLRTIYSALPAYTAPKFRQAKAPRETTTPRKKAAVRPRSLVDELLSLGLYDEAAPEFESSKKPDAAGNMKAADLDSSIAAMYSDSDLANRGVAMVDTMWKIPADYQIELLPREIVELLYPAPFADALMRHAPQRNVDPRFLLSIMRQESRFRAETRSPVAARGLMQFISTTANRVAAELGRENFQQDDLYDPSTAILFGSHYIGNLFKSFPDEIEAVTASYNGGDDNVNRWVARAKSTQPDRYVPEIMYAQTKDYVLHVMSNYRMYKMLYDEDLKFK